MLGYQPPGPGIPWTSPPWRPVARHAGIAPPLWRPVARHAGIPPARHAGIPPPCRQTHTCKNITFATSLRTVIKTQLLNKVRWWELHFDVPKLLNDGSDIYGTCNTSMCAYSQNLLISCKIYQYHPSTFLKIQNIALIMLPYWVILHHYLSNKCIGSFQKLENRVKTIFVIISFNFFYIFFYSALTYQDKTALDTSSIP